MCPEASAECQAPACLGGSSKWSFARSSSSLLQFHKEAIGNQGVYSGRRPAVLLQPLRRAPERLSEHCTVAVAAVVAQAAGQRYSSDTTVHRSGVLTLQLLLTGGSGE